jgi:chromosome segregation ATPase
MSESDAIDQRLRAVERALTDDESDLTDLRTAAERTHDVEALSARLDDVDERLDELDAATQALRGYVGNVREVNESVERRADAALAKAESLEAAFDDGRARAEPDADDSRSDADAGRPRSDRRCGCDSSRRAPSRRDTTGFEGDDELTDADGETDDRGLLARIAELL